VKRGGDATRPDRHDQSKRGRIQRSAQGERDSGNGGTKREVHSRGGGGKNKGKESSLYALVVKGYQRRDNIEFNGKKEKVKKRNHSYVRGRKWRKAVRSEINEDKIREEEGFQKTKSTLWGGTS